MTIDINKLFVDIQTLITVEELERFIQEVIFPLGELSCKKLLSDKGKSFKTFMVAMMLTTAQILNRPEHVQKLKEIYAEEEKKIAKGS